jgi:succinylarginine dihydrolase
MTTMTNTALEINFDGLVGPTHNYAGLAYGNLASTRYAFTKSNPRAALLQGLEKMKLLADLGVAQALLPPHERPDLETLRLLGFGGSDAHVLAAVARDAPVLFAACYSSSSMWAANAATVSPSPDTLDGRVHVTPANLVSQAHRSIEASFTGAVLKTIFKDEGLFVHHSPLPGGSAFSDEGAANHTRLCRSYGQPGIEIFTYGREAFHQSDRAPRAFPARQTLEASSALARLHRLDPARMLLVRQNPDIIDRGVFHNDVISVGNQNVLLCHALAFEDGASVREALRRKFSATCGDDLIVVEVTERDLPVSDAVDSYLFNSQLVTLPNGSMCLVAPNECRQNANVQAVLSRILAENDPITTVTYVDVRESMRNGGGPACLRLRVVLTEEERIATHQGIYVNDRLYERLVTWGNRWYREALHVDELTDPHLIEESRAALDQLTDILGLGSVYRFQRA